MLLQCCIIYLNRPAISYLLMNDVVQQCILLYFCSACFPLCMCNLFKLYFCIVSFKFIWTTSCFCPKYEKATLFISYTVYYSYCLLLNMLWYVSYEWLKLLIVVMNIYVKCTCIIFIQPLKHIMNIQVQRWNNWQNTYFALHGIDI